MPLNDLSIKEMSRLSGEAAQDEEGEAFPRYPQKKTTFAGLPVLLSPGLQFRRSYQHRLGPWLDWQAVNEPGFLRDKNVLRWFRFDPLT